MKRISKIFEKSVLFILTHPNEICNIKKATHPAPLKHGINIPYARWGMARIFAVGGGKGGSGKSFISANLGVMLANNQKKVLLIDLDLGTPNLHTMVGLDNPRIG